MARRAVQSEVCAVLLKTYGANDCMNQLLLEHLDARAWRASPEAKNKREARTVAGIFAHLHNNGLSWIKNSAPHLKCLRRSTPRVARACRHAQLTGKAQHQAHHRGRRSRQHINWATSCPTRPGMGFDGGRSFASSAPSRRGQGVWQVARTSTRKSQQTSAYLET
jgi:hypothetical protein